MSAIAGIFYRDGRPVGRGELDRMGEVQAHRGPDATGIWVNQSVGLTQRMLWTTPESRHEQLPQTNPAADLVITADARLDNRDDLIRAFGIGDQPADEITDGELILRAYEHWGEGCAVHLLGDFAFAIWDGRQQKLVCARDPIGVKPLYYYCREGLFAFATEIKGLLSLPAVPRRLNEMRVAQFLVPSFDDLSITFYRDILRLPAASVLIVDRSTTRIHQYWALDRSRTVRFASDGEYAEGFREIFSEAIRSRLRSAGGVSSTLSGGLDSSSIASVAAEILATEGKGPLATYSAVFPHFSGAELTMIDEREYVKSVIAQGGFHPHYIESDCLSPIVRVGGSPWNADEPFIAPNLYMHWAMYRAARQDGIRVFLDGIDGDTTVSHGLGYLRELAASGRWLRLRSEVSALSGTSTVAYTPQRILWEYAVQPLLPVVVARGRRWLDGRSDSHLNADSIVNPEFARRVGLSQRLAALDEPNRVPARTEREVHRRGLTSSLIPSVLEIADKATAAFGLEARYPFFDRRLVEFCLALPGEQKLRGGYTRNVMRQAMTGILPQDVQWRTHKANLSPSFTRQLLACERDTLDRIILASPGRLEQYVAMPELRSTYERYIASPTRSPGEAMTVYIAVMLALWLEETDVLP